MASQHYALILGASSGFGRAAARALAKDGMHILGVHLDRAAGLQQVEELKAELTALGVRSVFFNVNAADPERRKEVLDAVGEELAAHPGASIRLLLHSLAFGTLKPFIAEKPGD
ncbi:MAG: SDR family NAD(P)-dependent oxidoreductase, partial [Candidatus Kapabacteria bacterium]|nr:SDR family NAD(P)-dependent oxidoreductase [Candidatus Kapabacteria bacterium]